ncbi:MAG: hypothetical protein V3T02_00220 [Alphaproteobacteria bacterium]
MTSIIQLLFGAVALGAMIFALPSFLLLVFAMLPTFGAYVIDYNPNRSLTRSVGFLNFAGAWPFLLQLWTGSNSVIQSVKMLTDPYAWLLIYSAAALGWLFYLGFPSLGLVFQDYSAEQQAKSLRIARKKLEVEWGDEVMDRGH